MELPAHWRDFDLGLELADDVSAADWLDDALHSFGDGGVRLASFVPDCYEAFARILHPYWGARSGRWAEIAAPRGVTIDPDTTFYEASGLRDGDDAEQRHDVHPSDGSLPSAEMAALGEPSPRIRGRRTTASSASGSVSASHERQRRDLLRAPHRRGDEALTAPIRKRWQRERAAIDAVLASPDLEAVAVTAQTPLDPGLH